MGDSGYFQPNSRTPRGAIDWIKGPLATAGSINGKPVAVISNTGSGAYIVRINGWIWNVTQDMGSARFSGKIGTTPVKCFTSLSQAKKVIAEILLLP